MGLKIFSYRNDDPNIGPPKHGRQRSVKSRAAILSAASIQQCS